MLGAMVVYCKQLIATLPLVGRRQVDYRIKKFVLQFLRQGFLIGNVS